MGNNNLNSSEKTLRSIAKRYENVKYSVGLAVLFLMKGTSAFSDDNMIQEVERQKEILTDVKKSKADVKETKKTTQTNQKLKASWVSMQFGANDMYSNLFNSSKTKVDKASVVKSEKTVLVVSSDNSTSLPMFAKLLSDIEESTETRTEVLSSIANNENISSETQTPTIEEIKAGKENLKNSVENLQNKIDTARRENNKEINGLRLELIQLMEQGNQVVKSPWSSWQFGANYFYENWGSSYKGRGDKKEKYPFEGVYTRSDDLFLRNVSPDSELYGKYIKTTKDDAINSALSSTLFARGRSTSYGLASNNGAQEPITTIELGASVKPKNISKSPITVLAPVISVAAVTPLLTPEPPDAPTPPVIKIPVFNPVAPEKITVSLPTPPTFNIKLGSYRNYMTQNFLGDVDGGRHSGNGQSYNASDTQTIDGSTLTQTAIYSWASPSARVAGANFDSALLKAYFDYTTSTRLGSGAGSGGGTLTVTGNMSIDSIRGSIADPDPTARPWNNQDFLVGGSRIATLDNAAGGGTIRNEATINMVGPLVVGYEIQNDNAGTGKREVLNVGTLTDDAEKGYRGADGLGGLDVGYQNTPSNSKQITLSPNLRGDGLHGTGRITVTRTPDEQRDQYGNPIVGKEGGYVGYKIGMILTHEFDDRNPNNNYYSLVNGTSTTPGTISFKGKSSIGIQVYAPHQNAINTRVEVINDTKGRINLEGVESYGLKLSSRILEQSPNGTKSVFENRGSISISGSGGASLSSGIAVVEDEELTGLKGIRAYTDLVKNKGAISVSGGQGNTGIFLKVRDNDDIRNVAGGTISVSGNRNIGMRVDLGKVITDNAAGGSPKAINNGKIIVGNGEQNIGIVANNSETSGIKAIATNNGTIEFVGAAYKAIGLFAQDGAEIVNSATGKITGPTTGGLNETLGMVIQGKVAPKNVPSSGINNGEIDLTGTKVTGIYNQGTFTMENGATGTAKVTTSGVDSISLYAKGNSTTTNINSGKVIGKDGALTMFADDKATVNLGTTSSAPELESHGVGSLLFYNYTKSTSGTYTADGIFKLNNPNVKATLTTGATAFYFKDTTPAAAGVVTNSTADKLNAMFAGSGTNKIKLKLSDKDSTLFVLDNTTPNVNPIKISEVGANTATVLGNFVEIDKASSQNYKAYKATKATLSIDEDVDLDNHSGSAISKYYRVDFLNSAVTVETGKKMVGTDAAHITEVIAQANYADAKDYNHVKVTNNGTIEFSKRNGTGIAVDYGQAINNGVIKVDAANIAPTPGTKGENSIGLFGASGSKLTNNSTGEIYLGTRGVGIWGTNELKTSVGTWGKNIDITNAGKIIGLANKDSVFGIYADNDTTSFATATSNIVHSGEIDLSQNKESVGIYMKNGDLTSTGNISVNEGSVGIDATNSDVTINAGTYTVGKESVGFKLTNLPATKKFLGNSGNISITGEDSVAYLLNNSILTSGTNFKDDLTLNSTKAYTYINTNASTLNYENIKTIANDDSMFINAGNNSTINLLSGTNISSTNKAITGVYSTRSTVKNAGTITLTGDKSSALYAEGSTVSNESTGKITVAKDGSGIYVKALTTAPVALGSGTNYGEINIGEASVGIRAEDATIINETTGKITSTAEKATGMSQSGGSQDITNKGIITLTGDKSTALHSEGITTAGHKVINTGDITVGDSSNELSPSVGIYSANGTTSTVESSGKVVVGNKSTAIYAGNIDLIGNSETTAGNGGIGLYSKEGTVNISANSKITVGSTLGTGKEGVGVYLAGNNQTLNSDTDDLTIGHGSFGYVMTGQGNTVRTGMPGTVGEVSLSKDSVFIYSGDKTGTIRNYTNIKSTGDENYGIYALGAVENRGNIDFSQGIGNVGAYSYVEGATTTPNAIKNYGTIKVSKTDISDPDNRKYGIGMAAGFTEEVPAGSGNFVTRGLGNIENYGTIQVTTPDSIGMYATGRGSRIYNNGRIELSGAKRNIGMFAEHGAELINDVNGVITTVGTGNVGQIAIAVTKGATLENKGTIHIDASKGYGLFLAGAIVKNYGEAKITVANGAIEIKEVTAADTSKEMKDTQGNMNKIRIHSPAGAAEAKIIANGVVQTPTVIHVQAIPNRKPNDIPTSSLGMYVDTSGINYTRPITNIGALRNLTQSDLIIGTEATKYTTSKYIQLGQDIIEPFNDMIRTSGIEKWNIYSGSLTWMASITQLPDFTIRNAYLAKIPYTVFAGNQASPVAVSDTYNFLDGLEQRYGVEEIGTRENKVFQKLNSIGNNEEILFHQATDEMMGHQYANVQQRIVATGDILDKEFKYLRKAWSNPSKDVNKIKTFGTNGEYRTDTAGVIDYKNNAYGVAYVHEDETVRLGESTGWYAGIVHNRFRFKDIGNSREEMLQAKFGLFKSVPFDENNSLNWIISGDIFAGYNKMHRKFLVVDEVFNAKGRYHTYGVGIKNEISKEFRLSESFTFKPYAALGLEYGRVSKIKEKSGEIKLDVKSNDYFSVRPEIGAELGFKHYFDRKTVKVGVTVAYENELGRVANGKNKAKVAGTEADYFNIRGEKDDRAGNVKTDLNIGWDNQRVGVTANLGYDTKGHNVRAGVGIRVIF